MKTLVGIATVCGWAALAAAAAAGLHRSDPALVAGLAALLGAWGFAARVLARAALDPRG